MQMRELELMERQDSVSRLKSEVKELQEQLASLEGAKVGPEEVFPRITAIEERAAAEEHFYLRLVGETSERIDFRIPQAPALCMASLRSFGTTSGFKEQMCAELRNRNNELHKELEYQQHVSQLLDEAQDDVSRLEMAADAILEQDACDPMPNPAYKPEETVKRLKQAIRDLRRFPGVNDNVGSYLWRFIRDIENGITQELESVDRATALLSAANVNQQLASTQAEFAEGFAEFMEFRLISDRKVREIEQFHRENQDVSKRNSNLCQILAKLDENCEQVPEIHWTRATEMATRVEIQDLQAELHHVADLCDRKENRYKQALQGIAKIKQVLKI